MDFNKIAGAVLLTALSAMVISKVGDILVPEEHFAAHTTDGTKTGAEPTSKPVEKDPTVAQALAQADPKKGEALVKSKCSSCHTWTKGGANKVGPNLYGVVGNKMGSHPGYSYSSGMKAMDNTWTFEALYEYLPNPGKMVKGTKMTFRLPKWKQRADVIAFLRTQDDSPEPLPKAEPVSKPEPAKPEGDKKAAPEKAPEPKKDEAKKTEPTKPAMPEKTPEAKPAPEKKTEAPKPEQPKAAPAEKTDAPAPETKPAEKTAPADKTAPAPTDKKAE